MPQGAATEKPRLREEISVTVGEVKGDLDRLKNSAEFKRLYPNSEGSITRLVTSLGRYSGQPRQQTGNFTEQMRDLSELEKNLTTRDRVNITVSQTNVDARKNKEMVRTSLTKLVEVGNYRDDPKLSALNHCIRLQVIYHEGCQEDERRIAELQKS